MKLFFRSLVISLFLVQFVQGQEITLFDDAITYRYYQDQERISYKEVGELMEKDSLSQLHWKRAKVKNTLANLFLIVEFSTIPIAAFSENSNPGIYSVVILGAGIGSIFFAISRQKSKRLAILRYNSLFDLPNENKNSEKSDNIQNPSPAIAKVRIKGINNHYGTGIRIEF